MKMPGPLRWLVARQSKTKPMLDPDTFLTILYVTCDDFFQCEDAPPKLGRPASLSRSETATLALFGQWFGFGGERGYWRWARRHLRGAFPALPAREQFNRLLRAAQDDLARFALALAEALGAALGAYEAIDSTGAASRDAKRRGDGWLWGQADIGYSNHLGWFEGLRVLAACTPEGVITGFCLAPASTGDQPLAEDFLSARHAGGQDLLPSVGQPAGGPYAAGKGFEGRARHARWKEQLGVAMLCAPKRQRNQEVHPWPKALRRWLAGRRQIIETVFDKLHNTFGLRRERPHCLAGFSARLAARVGLHNFCIYLNRLLGRSNLAFADLVDW